MYERNAPHMNDKSGVDLRSTIENMYTEGGHKKLLQELKHDTEYFYQRVKETAESPKVSQNPMYKKRFERIL